VANSGVVGGPRWTLLEDRSIGLLSLMFCRTRPGVSMGSVKLEARSVLFVSSLLTRWFFPFCYCRSISASFPCFLFLHSCTFCWSSSGVAYRVSICLNIQDFGFGFGPWPASFSVHRMRDQIATVDGRRCQFSYIILSRVSRLGIILSMHRTGKFPKHANHNQHAIFEQSWVDNMERHV
jgi:hypothetical protein